MVPRSHVRDFTPAPRPDLRNVLQSGSTHTRAHQRRSAGAAIADVRIPEPVERLLDAALVGELTVVDGRGRPVTYPLIPLYDGESIYLTSSACSAESSSTSARTRRCRCRSPIPVAVGGETDRATIQGDARVIEDDPHGGWERLLPIWEAKEPAIVAFLKERVALPLFFERALIEITPRRVLYWADGDTGTVPADQRSSRGRPRDASDTGAQPSDGLAKLATFPMQF